MTSPGRQPTLPAEPWAHLVWTFALHGWEMRPAPPIAWSRLWGPVLRLAPVQPWRGMVSICDSDEGGGKRWREVRKWTPGRLRRRPSARGASESPKPSVRNRNEFRMSAANRRPADERRSLRCRTSRTWKFLRSDEHSHSFRSRFCAKIVYLRPKTGKILEDFLIERHCRPVPLENGSPSPHRVKFAGHDLFIISRH